MSEQYVKGKIRALVSELSPCYLRTSAAMRLDSGLEIIITGANKEKLISAMQDIDKTFTPDPERFQEIAIFSAKSITKGR